VVWLGGGVLGNVAGALMLEEHALRPWLDKVEHPGLHPLSLALGVICFLFGWWASRHGKQRAPAA
jgi:hypothetical protein